MGRTKKIFLIFSVIFIILLLLASYDIATRTTFPGSKPQLKQRLLEDENSKKDELIPVDTLKSKPDSVPGRASE